MEQTGQIGILGGGQLGCMLMDAALSLGLDARIFAEAGSPAEVIFKERATVGAINEEKPLRTFLSQAGVIAFENEFVDCDRLEKASQGLAVRFSPSLSTLRLLQDKLSQKKLLTRLGLPTAAFVELARDEPLPSTVKKAYDLFEAQVVFKWSRMGYDGKGVCLAQNTDQGRAEALAFCERAHSRGIAVYAERKVAFATELAIIACRSPSGEFAAYPLVVTEQKNGICRKVLGPAQALGVEASLETQARDAALELAQAVDLQGCFALELFVDSRGQLLINEIAPRVHNSGHYTQDACETSQFENHCRALLEMPLGPTRSTAGFAMLNLLGPGNLSLQLPRGRANPPFNPPEPPLKLHWYGKSEVRPGRKLGHINGALDSKDGLLALENQLEHFHQSWVAQLDEIKRSSTQP